MSNEAKVGLFVIIALVTFTATFLSVATVQLAGSKVAYRTYFKFAGGLDSGTLVRFGGRRAGVIKDIGPAEHDPTLTEVTFELREGTPLNERSVARISSLNALGDNYLEIAPGSKDAPLIPPGGSIPSEEALTFADLSAKFGDVIDTANTILLDVKTDVDLLLGDLRLLTQNLQALTGETNQRNVEALLRNSNELIASQGPKIDTITTQIQQLLSKVDGTVEDLRGVARSADSAVKNVDATVTELREPIKTDLAELEATLIAARQLVQEVESVVTVNSADLQATIENFRNVSQNLEEFSNEIRQRPWSLVRTKPKPQREVPVGAAGGR